MAGCSLPPLPPAASLSAATASGSIVIKFGSSSKCQEWVGGQCVVLRVTIIAVHIDKIMYYKLLYRELYSN